MPRVVVPNESEERAAGSSNRRRRAVLAALVAAAVASAAVLGMKALRDRARKASPDTVFVSTPAWPKADPKAAQPKPPLLSQEYLLQVGAYPDRKDAEALADRLEGLAWPVSIVVPVSATDSLHKVIVRGFADRTEMRRVADSLSVALQVQVTIIEPMGTRSK